MTPSTVTEGHWKITAPPFLTTEVRKGDAEDRGLSHIAGLPGLRSRGQLHWAFAWALSKRTLSLSLSLTISLSSDIYGAHLALGAKATEVSKPQSSSPWSCAGCGLSGARYGEIC